MNKVADLLPSLSPGLQLKYEKALAQELGLIFTDNDLVWSRPRECLVTGGIRSGKSLRAAFRALCKGLDPKTRIIWIVGPTYPLAQEVFRYIFEWGMKLGIVVPDSVRTPRDGSRSLQLITGCTIETKTGEHAQRLASVPVDFIVMDEPGTMSKDVYEACLGRLFQKRGDLFMSGTLDDNTLKPRWVWYELMAKEWASHPLDARERAFTLPTWTNLVEFPLGRADPEFEIIRERIGDHKFSRMYEGLPLGGEYPCFPLLWQQGIEAELLRFPDDTIHFDGGAIGVDYGRTWTHPSAVVVLAMDQYDRYWVREAWTGYQADADEIESVVNSLKHNHDIYQGCVDPNQGFMGDTLAFMTATLGAGSTEMRISLTNGLLEQGRLLFDSSGPNVAPVWESMKMCSRVQRNGQLKYERPLGDDLAQCVNYAVEFLRSGGAAPLITIDQGSVRLGYQRAPDREGRV